MGGEKLWTWSDLSDHLKIPIATLKKWWFLGRLPGLRLGTGRHGLVRFDPRAIDRWLSEQQQGGAR